MTEEKKRNDEKIIKFDKLKDKIYDNEYDKFMNYMKSINADYINGRITFADLSNKLNEYLAELSKSGIDVYDFQKKIIKNSGLSSDIFDIEIEKLKSNESKTGSNYDKLIMNSFKSVFSNIKEKHIMRLDIKNEFNDLTMVIDEDTISLISEKKINFADNELNEVILTYKELTGRKLKILACEATKIYEYN